MTTPKPTLEDLKNPANYTTTAAKQRRGYEFERYLYDIFEEQQFKAKRPYKRPGEQIDGGIYFEGAWYLVEAKWHAEPLPVSEVYSFKGKVDGKFSGTRGFFISWSGYSPECADALSIGKDLKVILCDAADVERAARDGWRAVFVDKLMLASLYGLVYAPEETRRSIDEQETRVHAVEVIVEGHFDALVMESILRQLDLTQDRVILPAGSKLNAIRLARTLPKREGARRLLILDSDGNPSQDEELRDLPLVDAAISIDPEIEALFFPESDDPKVEMRNVMRGRPITSSDIDLFSASVLSRNPQDFITRLTRAIKGI
jgi:hypothetical protein